MKRVMKLRSSNLLGIALSDREFTLAEVGARRGKLRKWARWELPPELSLQAKPEAVGARLRQFLAQQGFAARDVVLGVPARWMIAESGDVPPVGREQALAALRLQAERLGLGDDGSGGGLIFDVAGADAASRPGAALLVGLGEGRVRQLRSLCDAAGLELQAITATGLALSEAFSEDAGDLLVLFGGQGTELVRRRGRRTLGLRHLNGVPRTGEVLPALTGELARALSLGGSAQAGNSVVLIGEPGFNAEDYHELADRLGREVRSTVPLEAMGGLSAVTSLNGEARGVVAERVWPAIALASVAGTDRLPVNFLDTKLAPPPPPRVDRRIVWGVGLALLLVIGIVAMFLTVRSAEQEAAVLEARLEALEPDITAAEALIEEVQFGRGFYETRPPVLDMMTALSRTFPPDGGIWASSFTMGANGKCQLQGRADTEQAVLSLRDTLMAEPGFSDVQLNDLRQAAGTRDEVSFSLGFTYLATQAAKRGDVASNDQAEESR